MEGEDTGGRGQEEGQGVRKEGEAAIYRPEVSKGDRGGRERKKA